MWLVDDQPQSIRRCWRAAHSQAGSELTPSNRDIAKCGGLAKNITRVYAR